MRCVPAQAVTRCPMSDSRTASFTKRSGGRWPGFRGMRYLRGK